MFDTSPISRLRSLIAIFLLVLIGQSSAQQPVIIDIPIEKYPYIWDYVTSSGAGRNCGYKIYGKWPALSEYTEYINYTVTAKKADGSDAYWTWSKTTPDVGGNFEIYAGGTWGSGPNRGTPCTITLPADTTQWTATLTVPAPRMAFTATPSPIVPGLVLFRSGCTDPLRKALDYVWDFGDGSRSTFVNPDYKYKKPGQYTVTLKAVNPAGAFNTLTKVVTVKGPSLATSIYFPDRSSEHPKLGDIIEVRAVVAADRTGLGKLSGVHFDTSSGILLTPQFQLVSAPVTLDMGDMEPGDYRTFSWRLRVLHAGKFSIGLSSVTGTDQAGTDITGDGSSVAGDVSGLKIEVTFPQGPITLAKTDPAPGQLSSEPGYQPGKFPVKVKVSVPQGGEPVKNVTLLGFSMNDGGLSMSKVLPTGLLEQPWRNQIPQPVPFPLTVVKRPTTPENGTYSGPLLPGQPAVEYDFEVEAKRPGSYDFSAVFTADPVVAGGGILQERGSSVTDVKGDLVLAVQLEIVNSPASIYEGEEVEVHGTFTNLTDHETIKLDPLRIMNGGFGVVRGPVEYSQPLPEDGRLGIFKPVLTNTADGKSAQFRARVFTMQMPNYNSRLLKDRQVLLDFAIGGLVVGEDGAERELEPSKVLVEWGNGKYQKDGANFLRAPVLANPLAPKELSYSDFLYAVYGNGVERVTMGTANGIVLGLQNVRNALPGMFHLGKMAVGEADELYDFELANIKYLWLTHVYMLAVKAGIKSETTEQYIDEIALQISEYYGRKAASYASIRASVSSGIKGFMTKAAQLRDKAYTLDYGSNEETADYITSWVQPTTEFVVDNAIQEVVQAHAVRLFWSKVSRSEKVANEVAEKVAKDKVTNAQKAEAAAAEIAAKGEAGDPRLIPAPSSLRDLPAGATMTASQARRAYAVDKISDMNMLKITDWKNGGIPIMIAVRSRAEETLEWMATSLGMTPKPVTVKPKNVSRIDVEFLEYRPSVGYGDALGRGGGDLGSVVLAEPIPPSALQAKLAHVSDPELYKEVVARYRQRWKEWYGKEALPADELAIPTDATVYPSSAVHKLKQKANKVVVGDGTSSRTRLVGSIDAPKRGGVPEAVDNLDTRYMEDARVGMESRQLELRQVIEPPGNHHFESGREYYEMWIESEHVGNKGVLKRVSGDQDVVMCADIAGKMFGSESNKIADYGAKVAALLKHSIDMQHPWTSTWESLSGRYELLKDHVWNATAALRGEPLLVYVNGERRIAYFDPSKFIDIMSFDPDKPFDALVFLDGPDNVMDDVVRSQLASQGIVDPVDAAVGAVSDSKIAVRGALIAEDYVKGTDGLAICPIKTDRTVDAAIFRLGALGALEKRNRDGSWTEAPADTLCSPAGIVVVPETGLFEQLTAGISRIPILEDMLGDNWRDQIRVGDQVVIDAGLPTEEVRTVVQHGSLILDRPLQFSHPQGARVSLLTPGVSPKPEDGLAVWLKADAGISLNTYGEIQQWTDQAAGVVFRPGPPVTPTDSGLGVPAVEFDAAYMTGGIGRTLTKATVMCLVRFTPATTSGRDYVYSLGAKGRAGGAMSLARWASNLLEVYDGATTLHPGAKLSTGQWLVLTQTFGEMDPAGQRVYVDGYLVAETKGSAAFSVDANQICLGSLAADTNYLDGDMMEWMLFDKVLGKADRAIYENYLMTRGGRYLSPSGRIEIGATVSQENGTPTLKWPGTQGKIYLIESSPDLTPNSWREFTTVNPQTTGIQSFVIPRDEPASATLNRYFRIRVSQ